MSTAQRRTASPERKLRVRLLLLPVMIAAAIPLALWQVKRSDLSHAEEEVRFRYPQAELIEVQRGEGLFPHEMTAFCWEPDKRFVFHQHFTRDGASWYTAEGAEDSYENLLANREKVTASLRQRKRPIRPVSCSMRRGRPRAFMLSPKPMTGRRSPRSMKPIIRRHRQSGSRSACSVPRPGIAC